MTRELQCRTKISKYIRILSIIVTVMVVMCACGGYTGKIKKHKAAAMFENDILSERNEEISLGNNGEKICSVTFNVYEKMTDDDMLDVLDYKGMILNAQYDETTGEVIEEMKGDYYCFALFCEETSDKIIGKYKYVNHESVTYTEEDEYMFLNPRWERQMSE